jgi:hypothetical protein
MSRTGTCRGGLPSIVHISDVFVSAIAELVGGGFERRLGIANMGLWAFIEGA